MKEKNYGLLNISFIDKIIIKKRKEMLKILKDSIGQTNIESILDVGTVDDTDIESSNFFIKNFEDIKIRKSISDQKIKDKRFSIILNKSITTNFTDEEIIEMKSDLVVSSATIEHVGSNLNQIKMIENISKLTTNFFFISTPNRFFPIDFHTKIPLLHLLPKKIHRKILIIFGLNEYAKEENLNLISETDLKKMVNKLQINNFNINFFRIKLLGFTSNLVILGKRNNS